MSHLPSGYVLIPDREKGFDLSNGEPPGFRIEKVLGSGGFGVTYLATRTGTAGVSEFDLSDILWLPPGSQVVVKEFAPRDMSNRDLFDQTLNVKEDCEEPFEVFLARFRKEAERLFLLTCLRTIKAVDQHLDVCLNTTDGRIYNQYESWRALEEQIFLFYRNCQQSRISESQMVAEALDILAAVDLELEQAAKEVLTRSNLPTVYDYFEANGTAYYIMEFLPGGDLKQRISLKQKIGDGKEGRVTIKLPMPLPDFRVFASRMLNALDELHNTIPGRGLIHCDVKPNNIMFRNDSSDMPVLIDVGLSRSMQNELDESESIVPGLNYRYGAWELEREAERLNRGQKRGNEIGPWTDLFSMAIVFLELVTVGKSSDVPGLAKSDDQTGKNHARLAQIGFDYPPHIGKALVAALHRDIRARPQSVIEWRDMLALYDKSEPLPPPLPPPPVDETKNKPLLFALVGVALIVICGFIAMQMMPKPDSGPGQDSVAVEVPDVAKPIPGKAAEAARSDGNEIAAEAEASTGDDTDGAVPEQPVKAVPNESRPRDIEDSGDESIIAPTPVQPPLASGTWRDFPRIGLSARPIVEPNKVASLASSSGRRPNQPMRARSLAGSTLPTGVSSATEFVSACDGGSALAAIQAAERGSAVCLVTNRGAPIRIGR